MNTQEAVVGTTVVPEPVATATAPDQSTATAVATSTSTSTQPEKPRVEVVEEFIRPKNMTDEAHNWMVNPNSIELAGDAPYRFLGWDIVARLKLIKKSPLAIEDVKCLVMPDGDQVKCDSTKGIFQPVKYWPHVSPETEAALKSGATIGQITLPEYNGAFFVDHNKQEVFAVSGCKFGKFGKDFCYGSWLYKAAVKRALSRVIARGESWNETPERDRVLWGLDYQTQLDFLSQRKQERLVRKEREAALDERFGLKPRGDRRNGGRDSEHENGRYRGQHNSRSQEKRKVFADL